MDTLVSSYLSKKLSSGQKANALKENLKSNSRVQGLLSNNIVFTKDGPQKDPWLEKMHSEDQLNKNEASSSSIPSPSPSSPASAPSPSSSSSSSGSNSVDGTVKPVQGKKRVLDANGNVVVKTKKASPGDSDQLILRNSGCRGQVGLTNVGNTCYFNSMLQCLTNCKPFYNYIRSDAHDRASCPRAGDHCVLCLFRNFCVSYLAVNPKHKVINGGVLKDLLIKMRIAVRRWRIHMQQSADEILSYVMDSMWEREMSYYGMKCVNTPMFNLFGTVIEQQYACSLCGTASISKMIEPSIILGLTNGDRRSVQDRLRVEYGFAETLSEPKDKCNGCGRTRTPRPTMKRVLKQLPMVLVVMLKRFYVIDGISHKINQFVHFPEVLDLRPCMEKGSKQTSIYKLTGVVEHWGKSVSDGHYVAYCKNYCSLRKQESWFYLNDTLVRPIDLREVLQKNAFLMFYTAQGPTNRVVKVPLKNGSPYAIGHPNRLKARAAQAQEEEEEVIMETEPRMDSPKPAVVEEFDPDKPGCSGYQNDKPQPEPQPLRSKTSDSDYSSENDDEHHQSSCAKKARIDEKPPPTPPYVSDEAYEPDPVESSNDIFLRMNSIDISSDKMSPSTPNGGESPLRAEEQGSRQMTVESTTISNYYREDDDDSDHYQQDIQRNEHGYPRTPPVPSYYSEDSKQADEKLYDLLDDNTSTSQKSQGSDKPRKSMFGNNFDPKMLVIKKKSSKTLVPYESSEEDDDYDSFEKSSSKRNGADSGNSGQGTARFASSVSWVIDKLNDTPSIASNSSHNSSVQGTSPGWRVSTNGSPCRSPSPSFISSHKKSGAEGSAKKENVFTVSYTPQSPHFAMDHCENNFESEPPAPEYFTCDDSPERPPTPDPGPSYRSYYSNNSPGTSRSRDDEPTPETTSSISFEEAINPNDGLTYWGARKNETKTERDRYNEELDRGRQKKRRNHQPWKGGDRRADNPFQREQDARSRYNDGGLNLNKKPFKETIRNRQQQQRAYGAWRANSSKYNNNGKFSWKANDQNGRGFKS